MLRYILAGLVLGLLLGQGPVAAPAQQKLSSKVVRHVMDRVVVLGGFDQPAYLPPVHLVPARDIPKQACASGAASCRTLGVFVSPRVYLDRAMDVETREHVLAHELVHFLQELRDGPLPVHPADRCRALVAAEREAYHLQWEYRSIRHGFVGSVQPVVDRCG